MYTPGIDHRNERGKEHFLLFDDAQQTYGYDQVFDDYFLLEYNVP